MKAAFLDPDTELEDIDLPDDWESEAEGDDTGEDEGDDEHYVVVR